MIARKRYSDEDVLRLLREIEANLHDGMDVVSAYRQAGASDKTYYVWRKKFEGMGKSGLAEKKTLEKENSRLKRSVAADVLEVLYHLILKHGKPEHIRADNGREFIAEALQGWLIKVGANRYTSIPDHPERTDTMKGSIGYGAGKFKYGVVYIASPGTNRHQYMAKTVQSYPTAPGHRHTPTSP